MHLLLSLAVNGFAIWLASLLLDGISMALPEDALQAVLYVAVVAVVFTVVNGLVRPIAKVVSLPLMLMTFGLFALVVNALMLMLTGYLTQRLGYGLTVENFWWALAGSVVISILVTILNALLPKKKHR